MLLKCGYLFFENLPSSYFGLTGLSPGLLAFLKTTHGNLIWNPTQTS
jgi:hypothetical protein